MTMKKFLEKMFATGWQKEAGYVDQKLQKLKLALFSNVSGTVLEIGPGTGVNFEYFPAGIGWIGVEPNVHLQKVLRGHPKRPEKFMLVSDIGELPKESIDAVVSTLVLCSVPDLSETLHEIRRVLRPGGRFLSIEHVAAPRSTLLRLGQKLIRPLSKAIGGGCHPDREIGEAIQRTGFSEVNMKAYRIRITHMPVRAPIIACEAIK